MSTISTLTLLSWLFSGTVLPDMTQQMSSLDSHLLPPICIAELGPLPDVPAERWRPLIPTVVIGVDLRPDWQRRSQTDTDLLPDSYDRPWAQHIGGVDVRDHSDSMMRWTIALRWEAGPGPSAGRPLPEDTLPSHCSDLAHLRTSTPKDLNAAAEYWTESNRLRALLDHQFEREVRR